MAFYCESAEGLTYSLALILGMVFSLIPIALVLFFSGIERIIVFLRKRSLAIVSHRQYIGIIAFGIIAVILLSTELRCFDIKILLMFLPMISISSFIAYKKTSKKSSI